MECIALRVPVQRKELERDAVPTVKINPPQEKTPATGKRKADDFIPALMSSTPKKPRRAFQKRETRLIPLDSVMVAQTVQSGPREEVVHTDASANDPHSPAVPHESPAVSHESPAVPHESPAVSHKSPAVPHESLAVPHKSPAVPHESLAVPHTSPDVEQVTPKETKSVGSQRSLQKPQRRSHYTRTKWKTYDKEVQAVPKVKTREIGVRCNLLPAPPLHAQPTEVPVHESFASEETESEQGELEETDYSLESTESGRKMTSGVTWNVDMPFSVEIADIEGPERSWMNIDNLENGCITMDVTQLLRRMKRAGSMEKEEMQDEIIYYLEEVDYTTVVTTEEFPSSMTNDPVYSACIMHIKMSSGLVLMSDIETATDVKDLNEISVVKISSHLERVQSMAMELWSLKTRGPFIRISSIKCTITLMGTKNPIPAKMLEESAEEVKPVNGDDFYKGTEEQISINMLGSGTSFGPRKGNDQINCPDPDVETTKEKDPIKDKNSLSDLKSLITPEHRKSQLRGRGLFQQIMFICMPTKGSTCSITWLIMMCLGLFLSPVEGVGCKTSAQVEGNIIKLDPSAKCSFELHEGCKNGSFLTCQYSIPDQVLVLACVSEDICINGNKCPEFTKTPDDLYIVQGGSRNCTECPEYYRLSQWRNYSECYNRRPEDPKNTEGSSTTWSDEGIALLAVVGALAFIVLIIVVGYCIWKKTCPFTCSCFSMRFCQNMAEILPTWCKKNNNHSPMNNRIQTEQDAQTMPMEKHKGEENGTADNAEQTSFINSCQP